MRLSDLKKGRRSVEKIALADKLDVARTVNRLKHRIQSRHELNVIEAAIIDAHEADLAEGLVRGVGVDEIEENALKELGRGS